MAKRLEEIWLPGNDFPVILPRNSEALFMIQRIRDEAHRFAITYQRAKRKNDIGSVLAEIPGLGPARVKVLLKHFGSVTRLKDATPEQIGEVQGHRCPRLPRPSSLGWVVTRTTRPSVASRQHRTVDEPHGRTARAARCWWSPGCPGPAARPSGTRSKTSAGTWSTTCRRRCCAPWSIWRSTASDAIPKMAAIVDVRGGKLFADVQEALESLRDNASVRVVFLDATDAALVRRFEQVRRPHPLQGDGTLLDGITEERTRMAELRRRSDIVIDTSDLNIHQLATRSSEQFSEAGRRRPG